MINNSTRNPIVLIHGYSDQGKSFEVWKKKLEQRNYDTKIIHICNYVTLTNEVTIKDIAEGFDLALSEKIKEEESFDAIVHSTGMLVIRAWLTTYASKRSNRLHRLKHLIGLAPASFGSPLAHKGRSWLGWMVKGNREIGPDFLEAGDLVLDALELGSKFTWDLAHQDLLASKPFYGPNSDTPYVFIFCGTSQYQNLRQLVNTPGTDGTVRWAGAALNTRRVMIDLTKEADDDQRIEFGKWVNVGINPIVPIAGLNHGTIMRQPNIELVNLVDQALKVTSLQDFESWYKVSATEYIRSKNELKSLTPWQQFVVRALDERDDPITDYNIQLMSYTDGELRQIDELEMDVHTYSSDKSLRCFHINLEPILNSNNNEKKWWPIRWWTHQNNILNNLYMYITVSSGSQLVGYRGFLPNDFQLHNEQNPEESGTWYGAINISNLIKDEDKQLFCPFTTTLIELRLNRQPHPAKLLTFPVLES